MQTNRVRQMLSQGQPTLGCFLGLGSPQVAELLAGAGLDWLVIEAEHSAVDMAQVEEILRAIKGSDTVPLVRVPPGDPVWIQRSLDAGAMGIVVPLVESVQQAEAIVRATRYPPQGTRGFGPLRASNFTRDYDDYFQRASDNILVVLIVETAPMAANLKAVAAVDGVDALIVGVRDLCLALGRNVMADGYDEVDDVLEAILQVSRSGAVAAGIHAYSPETLGAFRRRGFGFISYKTDYMMLVDQAREGLQAFGRAR